VPKDANRKRRSCIVIGAGLAGLAAAHYLARHHWRVTVLEAQDRFGGRVLSYRFPGSSLVCELGGEWIGNNHREIRELCKILNLKLIRHQYAFSFWNGSSDQPAKIYKPGEWPFLPAAKTAFDEFAKKFKKYTLSQQKELDLLDWWTHLKINLGFTESDLRLRDLMDSTDFGESIRMTSAFSAAAEYIESDPTDEMDFKVEGGNDRLVDALVADIRAHGGEVRTRAKVLEVHQSANEVRVKIADQRPTLSAQRCICAAPASALNSIEWHPALPLEKRRAADQLQYARIVKTAVLYNRRFWGGTDKAGFSTITQRVSDFCFDSTLKQGGPEGILCSYAVGDKADDVAAEPDQDAVMQWLTEDMIAVTAPKDPYSIKALGIRTQAWQRADPLGGAYAFYRPGQWFSVQPALLAPFKRVHFAGEHVADWQGFMEGAVKTGLDAAKKL
jgi:monoamine oxidase